MSDAQARSDLAFISKRCDWFGEFAFPLLVCNPEKRIYIEVKGRGGVFDGRHIFIGRGSYILGAGLISPGTVVGRFCSISLGAFIGGSPHDMSRLSTGIIPGDPAWDGCTPPVPDRFTESLTDIGWDDWIGANVVVLRGRRVGTGACIGAGSVVTKDVPPYAVVVGNPARIVRFRFPEKIIEALLESRWWNLPDEAIAMLRDKNIDECVEVLRQLRR